MTLEELREYNKIVIESAEEVSKPWKWATIILAIILLSMVSLYFFNPTEVVVNQDFNNHDSIGTTNNQKG